MDNGTVCYEKYLSGDDGAMEEIIIQYRDGLIWFLYGIVGNAGVAEDLAEDTFVLLCTKKPKDRKKGSFRTWLYTIGRNLAISYLRRRANRETVPLDESIAASDTFDAERFYVHEEEKRALYRAIGRLKPDYALALRLIYFDGMKREEVSRILNKSTHAADVMISRAREALKKELIREGFEP